MANFNNYTKYYDLLYKDKNYKHESVYIIDKIKAYFPKAKKIIELGSGSGEHAKYFCENNFEVKGIEQSKKMVELANSKEIKGFHSNLGDISNYKLDEKFDVAVSLFHVISYLTTNDSLINCFKSTYNHLKTNGLFVFDVWYTPAVYHQQPETRIKRIDNEDIKVLRIAEPEVLTFDNTVQVNFEVIINDKKSNENETVSEKHLMRHFSIPEIKMLAKFTGFEVLLVEEFLSEKPATKDTWGVCFILKKKAL